MPSVLLSAFARQMLDVAVANGGAATLEQMRDHRRKTPAEVALKTFVAYNMLERKGGGYVITPAGLLASVTGFYETKWGNTAPTPADCGREIADAMAPKMALGKRLIGLGFTKVLVDTVSAAHPAHFPEGRCSRCKTPSLADDAFAAHWSCEKCRAPGAGQ